MHFLEVGALVRHPSEPDWGLGQIQSIVEDRITVNFQNAGKRVFRGDHVELEIVEPEAPNQP